jgi:hypothetical protein
MIFRSYNGGSKTLTGTLAQTIVFNSSDIPGTGVSKYHLDLGTTSGTTNDYSTLLRFRVKAAGQTIWDILPSHHQAIIQAMGRSNLAPVAGSTSWTLPLTKMNYGDNDAFQYLGGMPKGLAPTVEVDKSATGGPGTLTIGWTQSDQPFQFFPKWIGSQTNIAAGVTNGRVPITQDGLIAGFSINTQGLARVKVKLSGVELMNISGEQLLATQQVDNTVVVTNPYFVRLEFPMGALGGDSYFELDTTGTHNGGTWGGVTNEIGLYSILPNS